MANILEVFNFKNNYQVTNLFNELNLSPDQMVDFMDIINEGVNINAIRKQLLDYVSVADFGSYIHIKDLFRKSQINEQEEQTLGLNEVIELNELIIDISKKMNAEIHNKLVELFNQKSNQQIANIFFSYVKDAETSNKEVKMDITTKVGNDNVANIIYTLKNDILAIINEKKEEKKLNIKECFQLPKEFEKINKIHNIHSLQSLQEEYKRDYYTTNNLLYQQLLYETNLKINTQKLLKNNNLFESIDEHRKLSLWINNVGKLTINPLNESQWELIHYKHSISPISTESLKSFLNNLMKDSNKIQENGELAIAGNNETVDDKGLISQVMPKFIMDIQDQVSPEQKHQGIKIQDKEVEESTCAGGIATITQPISKKKKTSKDFDFAKEALEKIDEFKMTLNKKSIDFSSLNNNIALYVEGKIANVKSKDDVLKLFEMIDNNEDISQYIFEGLSKDDLDLLNEDGDVTDTTNVSTGISTPDAPTDNSQPDKDQQYKQKKEKLATMAQSSVGDISVKTTNTSGEEVASDDYTIVGIDDLDDSGKASSAVIKNKLTGEIKTVDPHKIDIKESSNVKLNGLAIYLTDDEQRIYDNVKEAGKLFTSKMTEFDCRIANKLVTKHLLKKFRNPENGLYYKTAGRKMKGNDFISTMTEVAPPSKEIESWIQKNKEKFKKQYGDNYKKFLYGKAWSKYNGLKESFIVEAKEPKDSFSEVLPCGKEIVGIRNGKHWLIEILSKDKDYLQSFIVSETGNILNKKELQKICESLDINEKVLLSTIAKHI